MTPFHARQVNLQTLNTLTKYPSIPTYHTLNPANGRLSEPALTFPADQTVIGTEKIDGTNSRIIFTSPREYFLGSREELLYFRGDLIGNPAMGIVDALKSIAERLANAPVIAERADGNNLVVLFLEVFGGKVTGNSKQYTGKRAVGIRLFDVATVGPVDALLAMTPEQASAWRDAGGQTFAQYPDLESLADELGVSLVPVTFRIEAATLPSAVEETQTFLIGRIARTLVALDDGAIGRPEGIVVRSVDRTVIAKMRFEDYRRTLKSVSQPDRTSQRVS